MRHRYAIVVSLLIPSFVFAATPPAQTNYQGVLRSASDAPLTGTYDMVFSFWDAASGGNEILDDSHTGASGGSVSVSNGLFNVALGSGAATDGPGPGTYTALDQVFRDYGAVWLQVSVGGEILSPRTQVSAAAYALNATNLNGRASSGYLDTSAAAQTKSGGLTLDLGNAGPALTAKGSLGASVTSPYGGTVYLADGYWGVEAYGNPAGYFYNYNGQSIQAYGYTGGYFSGNGSYAYVADGGDAAGIYASGWTTGVYGSSGYRAGDFENYNDGSHAWLGYNSVGLESYGSWIGGFCMDTDSGAYADLGYSAYIVTGNGTKAFRQNHPYDKSRVVVYNSLEGNEVGTYTRGSAKLVNGEARIALDPTFAWTTNPDIGLTASATAHGDPVPLGIASLTTKELVVRGPAGSGAEFDYVVFGLRVGFEELPIVQPKEQEAPIPSMAEFAAQYASQPDLRSFNALERFKGMKPQKTALNLDASTSLRNAINAQTPEGSTPGVRKAALTAEAHPPTGATAPAPAPPRAPSGGAATAAVAVSAVQTGVAVVHVAGGVQPGDVLVADPVAGDTLSLGGKAADPLLAGVVVAPTDATRLGAGEALLAYAGTIVPCHVDADLGAIRAGDLLTSSPTPGHAMRATDPVPGTIVGKALQDLDRGTGTIRVLVMPR